MATTLNLSGVGAITGGVLNLNGTNTGMASITLLPGWRPRVAKRRRGVLGGKRHEDVVESIPLRVHGASELECMTALEVLAAALDQARSWKDGAAVDAVILNYAINGTTLANPLQTAVLGTPIDAADILDLPVEFNRHLQVFEVNPVTLPLERLGEWLGDEETRSRTNSTGNNPGVMTPSATFTDTLTTLSPYKLSLTNSVSVGGSTDIMLLHGRSSSHVVLLQGESGVGDNFASAADSDASGGNVGRYTPADTNPNGIIWSITIDSDVRWITLLAHLKNRSSTISYTLRAAVAGRPFGQPVFVGTDDNNPQIVSFNILTSPYKAITSIEIKITASGVGAAAHSLDIDTLGVCAIGQGGGVMAVRDVAITTTDPIIDHALLTRPKPSVTDSSNAAKSHEGIPLLRGVGNTAAFLVMGGTGTSWRMRDGTSAAIGIGFSMARRPAYLVPR